MCCSLFSLSSLSFRRALARPRRRRGGARMCLAALAWPRWAGETRWCQRGRSEARRACSLIQWQREETRALLKRRWHVGPVFLEQRHEEADPAASALQRLPKGGSTLPSSSPASSCPDLAAQAVDGSVAVHFNSGSAPPQLRQCSLSCGGEAPLTAMAATCWRRDARPRSNPS